jgi:hypothetical protein
LVVVLGPWLGTSLLLLMLLVSSKQEKHFY